MSSSSLSKIDLRSDTVTKPSAAMREAMVRAEVGDDVYGEDPTVHALEETVAKLLGKPQGLFVPSGTMGNQLALLGRCRPGDEVIVSKDAHVLWYECGAGAALAGVQFALAGKDIFFSSKDLEEAIKPSAYYYPQTRMVAFEDTHNRSGGRVWPRAQLLEAAAYAKSQRLFTHLDGARLWNACAATGDDPRTRTALFDSVTVCLSKGLGAPVGSVLCGDKEFITQARRHRKMLGAGMRQAGILAAAGLYALEHHRERLVQDHEHAKLFASILTEKQTDRIRIDTSSIETNIVNIDLTCKAEQVVAHACTQDLLISATHPTRIRIVTHLDVNRDAIVDAAHRFLKAVNSCYA